jgi:heavy metal sensor kinase
MFSSLRMRLTLWYVGAFSVVLALFSVGVFFFVERTLHERLDADLLATLQINAAALARHSPNGSESSLLAEALEEPRFPGQVVAVVDSTGKVLARKPSGTSPVFRLPATPLESSASSGFYGQPESNPDADDSCRGVYQQIPGNAGDSSRFLVVTASTELLGDQVDALEDGLLIAIVLALILLGSGGWWLARESLAPVADMAAAAEHITAENLGDRVPVKNAEDELGRLGRRFNDLLSRLSRSFSQQRQFMADASHELRTPVSVVRTAAQVALQKPQRAEQEYREALTMIEKQSQRLSRIVEDMFALARADMGERALSLSNFYLDELVAETVGASAVLGERRRVMVKAQSVSEMPFRGDEGLVRQMISNLLDNAIKYTPEGGAVEVGLRLVDGRYEMTVSDNGPGIPVEAQAHIFERFYRGDQSPDVSGSTGAGLGLSIARSIAELHHGHLTLQRSGPEGSTFCVLLPVA